MRICVINDLPGRNILGRHLGEFLKQHRRHGKVARRENAAIDRSRHAIDLVIVLPSQPGCSDNHMRAAVQSRQDVSPCHIRLCVFHKNIGFRRERLFYSSENWGDESFDT